MGFPSCPASRDLANPTKALASPFPGLKPRGAIREETRQRPKKRARKGAGKIEKKGKAWVMQKKEAQRRQGKEVRLDSKYSARRRTGQMKF